MHFKEGHQLATATTNAVEIPFPEDDPVAMVILCQILHLRNEEVPNDLTINQLLHVALLVDKYDCAKPVKPSAECWYVWWNSHNTSFGY